MIRDVKNICVSIRGVTPFIMHNVAAADPQNQWSIKMAPIKNKRKKTESDHLELRDLSFLSCLYWANDLNGLYLPTDNIRKMLLESGRSLDQKGAKKQVVGISFPEYLGFPFKTKNRSDMEALKNDPQIRYFKIVTIGRERVPSVRAIFSDWGADILVEIDTSIINVGTVESWFEYAGSRIGLGCRRPYGPTPGEFGRFVVDEFKEI